MPLDAGAAKVETATPLTSETAMKELPESAKETSLPETMAALSASVRVTVAVKTSSMMPGTAGAAMPSGRRLTVSEEVEEDAA